MAKQKKQGMEKVKKMSMYEMREAKSFDKPLIPDGIYDAVVKQVQEDLPDGKFGKRIRLIYLTFYQDKPVEFARTGYAKFTEKSKLGVDVTAMGIKKGDKFDTAQLVGKKVKIFVKQTDIKNLQDGTTRKQSVITDVLKNLN